MVYCGGGGEAFCFCCFAHSGFMELLGVNTPVYIATARNMNRSTQMDIRAVSACMVRLLLFRSLARKNSPEKRLINIAISKKMMIALINT